MAAWCGRRTAVASSWSCWPANAAAAVTDPPRAAAVASVPSVDRDMVDAIADAVATRVAINARAVVPAALLQLLQPGAVMYQPLHHLARDQFENMRVVIRAYEHSLVFEFTYHDNQRLCDVVLSAPPALGSAT